MEEMSLRKPRAVLSEVRLRLKETDIPADAVPRGINGERLILPTSARILVRDDTLRIEMIVHDPESWGDQYYEEPDFDDENPPLIVLNLDKDEIVRLIIGDRDYNHKPTAVLVFQDPLDVVESLTLTFASMDPNNPQYAIKALAKMLTDRLGIAIEETNRSTQDDYDVPF